MKTIIFISVGAYPPPREPEDLYFAHQTTAMETWDSIWHPDIKVLYVRFGERRLEGNTIYLPHTGLLTDGWFDDALYVPQVEVAREHYKFDYAIFSNASAFWNKRKLYERLTVLPRRGCCAANIGSVPQMSGSGIVLSSDVVDYMLDHRDAWDHFTHCDVAVSRILHKQYEFIRNERCDYTHHSQVRMEDVATHFHFRCKAAGPPDRSGDLLIMRRIHEHLQYLGKYLCPIEWPGSPEWEPLPHQK